MPSSRRRALLLALTIPLLPAAAPTARAASAGNPPPLAYSSGTTGSYAVSTYDPSTRTTRVVASSTHPLWVNAWARGSGRVYYSVYPIACLSCTGTRVDSVPAGGGAPRTDVAEGQQLSLSRNGATMVYVDGTQVYRRATSGGAPVQLTGAGGVTSAVISPDGTHVLFSRQIPGGDPRVMSLFTMTIAGSEVHRITGAGTTDIAGAWSPDSRRVLFARTAFTPHDHTDVYAVDPSGRALRLVASDASEPAWAENGWLGYVGRRGDDVPQVIVRSPGLPGAERLVTSGKTAVSSVEFLAGLTG